MIARRAILASSWARLSPLTRGRWPRIVRLTRPLKEAPMVRSFSLPLALVVALLVGSSSTAASDAEKQLSGVWKLESLYTESRATGEKKMTYGEKPNGYAILTPEKRVMFVVTAEGRKKPVSDEDRIAAFRSMIAYT